MKRRLLPILLCVLAAVLTACGATQEYDKNLIENSGFEEGDSGWTVDAYSQNDDFAVYSVTEAEDAPDGNGVYKVESTIPNDVKIVQEIDVDKNSFYEISCMIKTGNISEAVNSTEGEAAGAVTGASIGLVQSFCVSELVPGNTDWHRVTLYGETDGKTDKVRIALRLGYYSAECTGTAYFDDVSVKKIKSIPEGVEAVSMASFEFATDSDTTDTGKSKAKIEINVLIRTVIYYAAIAVAFMLILKRAGGIGKRAMLVCLGIALAVRLAASVMYHGFTVDINCFSAWARRMAQVGPFKFYSDSYFCDYPPLYMLVLGIIGLLGKGGLTLTEGFGLMLLKLPACVTDILCSLVIYKIGRKHFNEKIGSTAAVFYAFIPAAIVNSAVWGQVDSVLVLFLLLTFYFIDEDKFGVSVITYITGMLFKPQALLFAPVMALAAAGEFNQIGLDTRASRKSVAAKRLKAGFGGLGAAAAIFVLLSVAMNGNGDVFWLVKRYASSLNSYNYGTLNTFGFMGLIGGQWAEASSPSVFGISYNTLGTVLTVLAVAVSFVAYFLSFVNAASFKKENKARRIFDRERFASEHTRALWLAASLLVCGVVTFASRTHERYIFPAIALLIVCAIRYKDIRFAWLSFCYGVVNFVNVAVVLYVYEDLKLYMSADEPMMILGSLAVTLLYFATVAVAFKNVFKKEEAPMAAKKSDASEGTTKAGRDDNTEKLNGLFARRGFKLPAVTWKDIVICFLITAIYACFAFANLGDMVAPETQWVSKRTEVYAVADLGGVKEIDNVLYNVDSLSSFDIAYSEGGEIFTDYGTFSSQYSGFWQSCGERSFSARYIKISAKSAVTINEIALFSGDERIYPESVETSVTPIDKATANGEYLFDYDGEVTETVLAAAPQTAWNDGGKYIVTFEKPVNINEIVGYLTYGEPESTLDIYFEDGEGWILAAQLEGEYTDIWSPISYCIPASEFAGIERILLDGGDGAVHLAELAVCDEDGIVGIKSVSKINGFDFDDATASDDLRVIFDEQELYVAQKADDARLSDSKAWVITSCADYVIADFGETKHIDRGTYYTSVCSGDFSVYYSYDGENWSTAEKHNHGAGDLYYWRGLPSTGGSYENLTARYVAICAETNKLRFIEFGFFENADSETPIPVVNVISSSNGENGGASAFDEQGLVPSRPSYKNSMYFDEIYHARTAYESLNGMSIYEWTHPPLGKDIISWSVSVFGMNPFGWRFAGALAGVLMVPAMYFIGLLMFRKTSWASFLALLMATDGMHYAQTRIATIDSYGVMWIIFMFLFMYWYYSLSFYNTRLSKTFVPLGLCGLCFGLGAASKWICLYAGAGLAVIFFFTLFLRWREYKLCRDSLDTASESQKPYLRHVVDSFVPNTAKTVLFCVFAFVVIPLVIYCASYYPYFNAEGETRAWYKIILDNQVSMYSYHSKLEATHPFQSDWYTWPFIYKPILYYTGKYLPSGRMETISSFGNPAVWYMGLVCTVMGVVVFIKRLFGGTLIKSAEDNGFLKHFNAGDEMLADAGERDTRLIIFLLLGAACNLAPWIGISRCIFIYHYFATVPFIMMFTVYIFRNITRRYRRTGVITAAVFALLCIVLFIMFLPVWTGTETSRHYVNTYLKWFGSWALGS